MIFSHLFHFPFLVSFLVSFLSWLCCNFLISFDFFPNQSYPICDLLSSFRFLFSVESILPSFSLIFFPIQFIVFKFWFGFILLFLFWSISFLLMIIFCLISVNSFFDRLWFNFDRLFLIQLQSISCFVYLFLHDSVRNSVRFYSHFFLQFLGFHSSLIWFSSIHWFWLRINISVSFYNSASSFIYFWWLIVKIEICLWSLSE